jgi:hypothetical protein
MKVHCRTEVEAVALLRNLGWLPVDDAWRIHGTGIDGEPYTLEATIARLGSGDMVLVHSREV